MNNLELDKYNYKNYKTSNEIRWCPGCGDYVVLSAIQKVFSDLKIDKENTVFISGIGCSSRFPYYMNTYGLHSIHGRAIPIATGIKLSNPKLNVWVITGDGDCLSIGGNHLIHVLRRNINIKILMLNNRIYGLTKGQYSPTSLKGKITKSSPFGSIDNNINVSSLVLGAGATFFARSIDSNVSHMSKMIEAAYNHNGTSFLEIYQNCVVFNNKEFLVYKGNELYLEHGKKVLFNNESKGLIIDKDNIDFKVIDNNKDTFKDIITHNEENSFLSLMYGNIENLDNFPMPFGVIRKKNQSTYDDDLINLKHKLSLKKNNIFDKIKGKDFWTIS